MISHRINLSRNLSKKTKKINIIHKKVLHKEKTDYMQVQYKRT